MIKLYDRIKELSYVIGTSNITLAGSTRGFSTFSSCYSNNDILFYGITDGTQYELGSGIYISSSNEIRRFPVRSTNSNNLVNFSEGTKEVYVNYPATNSIFNTYGINPVPQNSGLAFWSSSNSLSYSNQITFDSGNGRLGINKSNPSMALDVGGNLAYSQLKVSGISVSESGIYFPSGNNGVSSYSGGRQLVHFQPNELSSQSSTVLELSGVVNQRIVLKKQNSNMIFAGPSVFCEPPCGPDYPTFRFLTSEDIPDLSNIYYETTNGVTLSGIVNSVSGILNSRLHFASGLLNNKIQSVSGILNSRISTVSGICYSASGALNSRITSVSGYFDNRINDIVISSNIFNHVCDGRLSISSNQSTIDGTGNVLYFVPHIGNKISLYNSSEWMNISFSSQNIVNFSSLDSNTIYDIFAYLNNNGNVSFEIQPWLMHNPNWNDPENPDTPFNSHRSAELNKFQGVLCKSGNNTRRYIGTVKTTSSGFIDNHSSRLIYNQYNKTNKTLLSYVNSSNPNSFFNFDWIYTGDFRYIPYISPIEIINGLDSYINLNVVLNVTVPYSRSEYLLGLIRKPEIYYYEVEDRYGDILDFVNDDSLQYYSSVILNNIDGFLDTNIIGGDYQDGLRKTIKSSIYCKPFGYEQYYAIEKTIIGSPIINGNNLIGNYGIMGTYSC